MLFIHPPLIQGYPWGSTERAAAGAHPERRTQARRGQAAPAVKRNEAEGIGSGVRRQPVPVARRDEFGSRLAVGGSLRVPEAHGAPGLPQCAGQARGEARLKSWKVPSSVLP